MWSTARSFAVLHAIFDTGNAFLIIQEIHPGYSKSIMSRMSEAVAQDLCWSLKKHQAPDRAFALMQKMENCMTVYSRTVRKIYTNYRVYRPESDDSGLVILPDFTAYHDMIHNISADAIEPTGVSIVPGAALGKKGLYITGKLKGRKASSALPLVTGLKAMKMGAFCDGAFLPILQYGDLREMTRSQLPYLHLHRVNLSKLTEISAFERTNVASNIQSRMQHLTQILDY